MNPEYLKVNIQLFADTDDKTEKATPKRKSQAREKGQVLQSREIKSAILLILAFLTLKMSGGFIFDNITQFTKKVFIQYTINKEILAQGSFWSLVMESILLILKVIAPILGVVLIAGLAASYAQVGFLFTTKTLEPKLDKLNPIQGFKRMFSAQALMELAKSLAKIMIVGYIAFTYIKKEAGSVVNLMDMEVMSIAVYIGQIVINVALRMGVVLMVIGIIDYIFQWKQHEKSMMMSKQEVKEEYKQTEGNPQIKSKIKQKQREISMRRMMSDIPKADVVITNPTHFAIAIKYDAKTADAPIVLAKGQDYIALRIKEIAKENRVEIVENKPLARALYDSADIGEKIPEELFQAVAEVLAFVYSLKNKIV
ncbi:flagellar biosynthesis protein FlhB [Petroclostridium sp. X23]|uniref:flagellar biosynthesis protein FlhB n=1 Tax=Petroclostridium sp. X23 TaxID=3045146 RepID=UPI0024AC8964|nr:flagellar biosynthesis protein FlhB [Petroclostridium sp. X23]WHH58951.1 flagellar biosynthesis protein FlhB [Petroclostridium sp. X23]